MTPAEQFDQIAADVSQEAAAVDCTPAEYREGLRDIINTLELDIAASSESEGGE